MIPGLLYIAAVAAAVVLGQGYALSYPSLSQAIVGWAANPALKSAGGAVLIVVFVLLGSVAAGLVAMAGGGFIERTWPAAASRSRRRCCCTFSAAARLTAWAVLYLVLGVRWWPAVVIALVAGAVAVTRGRLATARLADLIESAVDLHGAELAAQLGEQPDGPLAPALGGRLSTRMRKSRWDPDSPLAG